MNLTEEKLLKLYNKSLNYKPDKDLMESIIFDNKYINDNTLPFILALYVKGISKPYYNNTTGNYLLKNNLSKIYILINKIMNNAIRYYSLEDIISLVKSEIKDIKEGNV